MSKHYRKRQLGAGLVMVLALALVVAPMTDFLQAAKLSGVKVTEEGGRWVLKVETDGKVSPTVGFAGSDRLVIKVPEGTWLGRSRININRGPVDRVRVGKHPSEVWLVLDLNRRPRKSETVNGADGFSLDLGPVDTKAPVQQAKIEAQPELVSDFSLAAAGLAYRVVDLSLGEKGGRSRLVISSDGPARYKSELREGGTRLSLTFANSALTWSGRGEDLGDEAVKSITARQVGSRGKREVRLDIELVEALSYTINRDQNQVVVEINRPDVQPVVRTKGNLDTLVTMDFDNGDLVAVLKSLCEQAGFEYVFTQDILSITGDAALVTHRANRQSVRDVFALLLAGSQMFYDVQGNIVFFGSETQIQAKKDILVKDVVPYAVRYIDRSVLLGYLTVELEADPTVSVNTVMVDPDTDRDDRIIIRATTADVAKVMNIIRKYDRGSGPDVDEAGVDEESGGGKKRNKVFRMRFTDPNTMTSHILQVAPNSTAVVDVRTRSLLIKATPKDLAKIQKLLDRLDVEIPQVSIEGKIVEVNVDETQSLGIDWSAKNDTGAAPIAGISDPTIFLDQTAGSGRLTVSTLQNNFGILAQLNALATENKANFLSVPRIMAQDGVAALITTTDAFYIIDETAVIDNGIATVTRGFNQISIPLTLNVTPTINREDGIVLLVVNFDITSISGPPVGGGPPPTSSQNANTTVRVRNGETAVIGGLIRDQSTDELFKVPILGDLPLLGALFKKKTTTHQKKELIILLTPTIAN